jgi:archaellum biogenesis ATPase FlaH
MSNLSFLHKGNKKNLVMDTYIPLSTDTEAMLISAIVHSDTTNELDVGACNSAYKIFNTLETKDFTIHMNARIFSTCKDLGFKDLSINKINSLLPTLDPDYLGSLKSIGNQDINQFIRHFIETSVSKRIKELEEYPYSKRLKLESLINAQLGRLENNTETITDYISSAKARNEHILKYGYGLKTHIHTLNMVIKGFDSGQLIVIGGGTGMGKTALAVNIASHVADTHNTLFFTVEMTRDALMNRMAFMQCGTDASLLDETLDTLSSKKITIPHIPGLDIDGIERVSRSSNADIIFVDHLHMMRMHKAQTLESLMDITNRLKVLAMELKIPVVLLSQLNRNSKGGLPQLSDLRGSGSIEQDADIVILVYRAGNTSVSIKLAGDSTAEIIVAKNREGEQGKIYCDWDGPKRLFTSKKQGETRNNLSVNDVRNKLLKGSKK